MTSAEKIPSRDPRVPEQAGPKGEPPGIGSMIGDRYRLAERLGYGGMGTVWKAHDEAMDRDVAIKEPRSPAHLTPRQQETLFARMQREARAAARIDHPSVVDIYDVVLVDSRPWIVMELVRGESLASHLDEGSLPPAEVARITLPVLEALGAAHEKGILHRDVKPENVMLGPFGRVVLTDFGIAQIEGERGLTETGGFIGSPGYFSPERVLGDKPGPASDLFSLGVLMYTAVEGFHPFMRGTNAATLHAVASATPQPPAKAGELGPLILQLLAKEPQARPDVEQVAAVLKRVAGQPTAPSPAPGGPTRADRPTRPRRRRMGYALAAAVLAVATAVGGWLLPSPFDDDPAEQGLPKGWKQYEEKSLGASVAVPKQYKRETQSRENHDSVRYTPKNGFYDIEVVREPSEGDSSLDEARYWVTGYTDEESDYYDTTITLRATSLHGKPATELTMTYRDKTDEPGDTRLWRMRELYYVNDDGMSWTLIMSVPTEESAPPEDNNTYKDSRAYGDSTKADKLFDNAVANLHIHQM